MKLPEVVDALQDEMPAKGAWSVAILTKERPDGSLGEEIIEYAVVDVEVDDDDAEINLITDEGQTDEPKRDGLTLEGLLQRLEKLGLQYAAYSVYSSSAYIEIDDEYRVRCDSPLVGFARSDEAEIFGFLRYPPEQWWKADEAP